MRTWAEQLISFYQDLKPLPVPNGITWLHPQESPTVQELSGQFFTRYFNDTEKRTLMLGINPGRFGAGVTGVNFTAPRQLSEICGIPHPYKNSSELSAEFIYEVIGAYGGPEAFYRKFFIGSVCPLGFVKGGKNINYYDDKDLLGAVEPFIIQNLHRLVSFGVQRERCICIGGEKNFRYLKKLNDRYRWFETIIPVPHPRFILQYRRKEKEKYIGEYLHALEG